MIKTGSVFLMYQDPETQLAVIWRFDAVVSEQTTLESEVTEYAVEEGADMSDNIAETREAMQITGVITGATIAAEEGEEYGRPRIMQAKAELRRFMARRDTLTLITPDDVYLDMGIASASLTRDSSYERIAVNISLKKIRKAEAREADVPMRKAAPGPAKAKAGKTEANGGKTTGKPADPPPREQTALAKLTKGGKSVTEVMGVP